MSDKNPVIPVNVFLASPEDAWEERNLIKEKINTWSKKNIDSGYTFYPYIWKDDSCSIMEHQDEGHDGEFHILEQLIKSCDLLIAIFKRDKGTPYFDTKTGKQFPCATMAEIDFHVQQKKRFQLYFLDKDDSVFDGYRALIESDNYKFNGLYDKTTAESFRENIYEKIEDFLMFFIKNDTSSQTKTPLPKEISEILLLSEKDTYKGFRLLQEENTGLGEYVIYCGEKVFNGNGNHKSNAYWRDKIIEPMIYKFRFFKHPHNTKLETNIDIEEYELTSEGYNALSLCKEKQQRGEEPILYEVKNLRRTG